MEAFLTLESIVWSYKLCRGIYHVGSRLAGAHRLYTSGAWVIRRFRSERAVDEPPSADAWVVVEPGDEQGEEVIVPVSLLTKATHNSAETSLTRLT